MTEALRFLALAELIGLAALPLAATVLGRLPGAGLGFAKPLGLLLVTWLVWIGGSLDLVPYTTGLGDRGDRRRGPRGPGRRAGAARLRRGAAEAALVAGAAPAPEPPRARPAPPAAADRRPSSCSS